MKLKVIDIYIYICTYRDIQYMYNLVLYNYRHSGLNLVYIYLKFKGLSKDFEQGVPYTYTYKTYKEIQYKKTRQQVNN